MPQLRLGNTGSHGDLCNDCKRRGQCHWQDYAHTCKSIVAKCYAFEEDYLAWRERLNAKPSTVTTEVPACYE